MDSIIQMAAETRHVPDLAHISMIADKLMGCPRLILDDKTVTTACELTLSRPKVFREVMGHLRVPYRF
jgi:hypothetical protein